MGSAPTGILEDNLAQQQIKLYPNPAMDVVHISVAGNVLQAEATSVTGTSTPLKQTQDNAFDVSPLTSGIYFLTIKMGDNTSNVLKFVKQ